MSNSKTVRNNKGQFISGHMYLGEGRGQFQKGMTPWHKGKHTGLIPKSAFKKGHISTAGFKKGHVPWNWKGGITLVNDRIRRSIEYVTWRKSVWQRDRWTCVNCGHKGKDIVAHHVKAFSKHPELRFIVNNGVTLCRSCHKRVHSEIGFNTRFKKRWVSF